MFQPGSLTANEEGAIVLTEADDIEICPPILETITTAGGSHDRRPDHHTAALFAAAPDLFDLLEEALAAIMVLSPETHKGALGNKIRAALNRASNPEHRNR